MNKNRLYIEGSFAVDTYIRWCKKGLSKEEIKTVDQLFVKLFEVSTLSQRRVFLDKLDLLTNPRSLFRKVNRLIDDIEYSKKSPV